MKEIIKNIRSVNEQIAKLQCKKEAELKKVGNPFTLREYGTFYDYYGYIISQLIKHDKYESTRITKTSSDVKKLEKIKDSLVHLGYKTDLKFVSSDRSCFDGVISDTYKITVKRM